MRKLFMALAAGGTLLAGAANAAVVSVDLSGATTGTIVDGEGATFATSFVGQTLVGANGLDGTPDANPTLQAGNSLQIAAFGSNSILPQPGNGGPLSALLDSAADSLSFRAGFADEQGTFDIEFYDAGGNIVGALTQTLSSGYANYSFSGVGTFVAFSIFNNTDPAGLRFQNFAYNAVSGDVVPLPGAALFMATALAGAGAASRRKRAAA